MSHLQYVFRGSISVQMWDLQTSNFDKWLYFKCHRWSWLSVIQYFVWWLLLSYFYTYNICKNIPSRNHTTFITLSRFRICQFSRYVSKTVSCQYIHKRACFEMSYLYQCLDIRNILYESESAMLPPIFIKCQESKLWNIDNILCLNYCLFLFISEYDMCLSIMYVL